MPPKYIDRAYETVSNTPGTASAFSLNGAVEGFMTFAAAGAVDADTFDYAAFEGAKMEIGTGTYTATGTSLSRDTIHQSTNGGAAEDFTSDVKVFVTARGFDLRNPTVTEVTETVYSLTGTDVDPANGTVQTLALSANRTLTESLATGQAVRLLITGGDTYTVTWPAGIEWVDGSAPTLTAKDIVTLEKIGSDLIGYFGVGVA